MGTEIPSPLPSPIPHVPWARSPSAFTCSPCLPRFVALHSYSAQGPDELVLQKGEGVRVLGKCQDGWLRGVSLLTGRIGIFPKNCVIPIFRYVPSIPRYWKLGYSSGGYLWAELGRTWCSFRVWAKKQLSPWCPVTLHFFF